MHSPDPAIRTIAEGISLDWIPYWRQPLGVLGFQVMKKCLHCEQLGFIDSILENLLNPATG